MAVDIRYVGTRGVNQWTEENYNERNIDENGFLDEFKLAMANLQANQRGGPRVGTFAYFGASTGTAPLPIYLAYFNGRADASNTGGLQRRELDQLDVRRPPRDDRTRARPTPRGDLDGNADAPRATRSRPACPPTSSSSIRTSNGVNVYHSDAYSGYDALQIEVRRRLSRGFQINGSYQYALESGSSFLGLHYGRVSNPTANVRHAIKMQWDWSVPVGRGQRFGTDMQRCARRHRRRLGVQRRRPHPGAAILNFGNVRLVGMTAGRADRRNTASASTRIRATPDVSS